MNKALEEELLRQGKAARVYVKIISADGTVRTSVD
jgi:hypothetical protein